MLDFIMWIRERTIEFEGHDRLYERWKVTAFPGEFTAHCMNRAKELVTI